MRALRAAVVAIALLVVSAQMAHAQFAHVVTITVRPATGGDYADYMLRVNEAAAEIGDPRTVSVYRPVMGGSPFRFMLVTTFNDYAEMDSWMGGPGAILTQAYGEDDAEDIRETAREVIESVSVEVQALQPAFSSGLDLPQQGNRYLRIVTTEVEPSGNAAYGELLRAAKKGADEQGIKRNRWTRAQGKSFTHTATWSADAIGDLGGPSPQAILTEALGEEAAAALTEAATSGVISRTFETWQYNPALSRGPM